MVKRVFFFLFWVAELAAVSDINDIAHDVSNHEIEIEEIKERLQIQENLLDLLQEERRNSDGIMEEVRKLKEQYNTLAKILNEYKQKIVEQNKRISREEEILKILTDALQIEINKTGVKIYVVLAGDSLEKIAKKNGVSVKSLKEINNLKGDRIFTGQKLKLP